MHNQEKEKKRKKGFTSCVLRECSHDYGLMLLTQETMTVLQLLTLDAGLNNITGTVPGSWSNLTQVSTSPLRA